MKILKTVRDQIWTLSGKLRSHGLVSMVGIQQDGASVHNTVIVCDYLSIQFQERLLGYPYGIVRFNSFLFFVSGLKNIINK